MSAYRFVMFPEGQKTRFAILDPDDAAHEAKWNAPYNIVTPDVARTMADTCVRNATTAGHDEQACRTAVAAWWLEWFGSPQ